MRRAALVYPSNISKFSWQLERKWMRVYTASCAPSSFSSSTFETRNPGARVCRLAAIHIHVRRPSSPLSLSLSLCFCFCFCFSLCTSACASASCAVHLLNPQPSILIANSLGSSCLCSLSQEPQPETRLAEDLLRWCNTTNWCRQVRLCLVPLTSTCTGLAARAWRLSPALCGASRSVPFPLPVRLPPPLPLPPVPFNAAAAPSLNHLTNCAYRGP